MWILHLRVGIFLPLEYTLVDEKCLQKCELCQLNHPENEVTIPIQISSQLDLFTFPNLSLVVYKFLLFYTKPFRLLQNILFSCFFDICSWYHKIIISGLFALYINCFHVVSFYILIDVVSRRCYSNIGIFYE